MVSLCCLCWSEGIYYPSLSLCVSGRAEDWSRQMALTVINGLVHWIFKGNEAAGSHRSSHEIFESFRLECSLKPNPINPMIWQVQRKNRIHPSIHQFIIIFLLTMTIAGYTSHAQTDPQYLARLNQPTVPAAQVLIQSLYRNIDLYLDMGGVLKWG